MEVHLGEVVVGRPHPGQGGVQSWGDLGHIRPVAHKDGLVPGGKEVVHRPGPIHWGAGDDLHPQGPDGFQGPVHHGPGQDKGGNAVGENAPGIGQLFKDGDLIPQGGQVPGAGDACRAGANHRHLLPLLLHLWNGDGGVGVVPVGHKPLQAADGHGLPLPDVGAVFLTLLLLGTDPAADRRQAAALGDHIIGPVKVPLGHPGQELLDLLVDGAAGHAGLFPAVQAAHGLPHGLQGGVAQGHLVKVLAPEVLGLLRHRGPFVYQVDHFAAPSFGSRLAWRWSRLS